MSLIKLKKASQHVILTLRVCLVRGRVFRTISNCPVWDAAKNQYDLVLKNGLGCRTVQKYQNRTGSGWFGIICTATHWFSMARTGSIWFKLSSIRFGIGSAQVGSNNVIWGRKSFFLTFTKVGTCTGTVRYRIILVTTGMGSSTSLAILSWLGVC